MEGEAYRLFTGFPFRHYVNKVYGDNYAVFNWETILNAYNKKFSMFTGSRSSKYNGTNDFHAYGIIFVGEVIYNNIIVKILQVKNPWGVSNISDAHDYTLTHMKDESFKSSLNAKLSTPLSSNIDEGLFLIEYKDFQEHFEDLSISL
mmetsp:Transcript_64912/g.55084  ORF Transcript_64912/g.55084 Transcript_64912/m.55084 type:complete len:147 (+) Transcript_64912:870-1310(+)